MASHDRADGNAFPASAAQRRMYFLQETEEGRPTYHMPVFLAFGERVDAALLHDRAQALLDRHEALRTSFRLEDGVLLQVVDDTARLEWTEDKADTAEEIAAWQDAEYRRPFDLHTGPLFRAALLHTPDGALLVLALHHIAGDGWSVRVLVRELLADRDADGPGGPLPEPAFQYGDYSAWQEELLAGPATAGRLAHWAGQLAGELPDTRLPYDRRPAPAPGPGHRTAGLYGFTLSEEVVRRAVRLGRDTSSTLFATCLAVLQVALARHTGTDDVLVGTAVANRDRKEFEDTVGLFVNTVPVRAGLGGNPSFRDHLVRTRDTLLDAQDHQDLPFERIVEHVRPARSDDGSPLFSVFAGFHDEDALTEDLPGRVRLVEPPAATAKFDLTFDVVRSGGAVHCRLEYRADLYDHATVERFARHFSALLDAATARPGLRVGDLPMLTPAEQRPLTSPPPAEVRATAPDPDRCAHEIFAGHARRTPDAMAVTDGGRHVTYAELDRTANRIAHRLRALGAGPGTLVGLCVPRSADLPAALLGILKAGAAYLPLDPGNPPERIRGIIGDAGLAHLVGTAETRGLWDGAGLSTVDLDADAAVLTGLPETEPDSGVTPDDLAYTIYTSGSTGRPKGTLVPHRNITRLFSATDHWFGFGADDVWTLFHSIAFDFSVWELWGALLHGGRLVVVPYATSRSPEEFLGLLRRERVTVLNQTPSAFLQLDRADAEASADTEAEASAYADAESEARSGPYPGGTDGGLALRYVVFGGEALDTASLRGWFDRHGDTAPRLVNMYGITETTVHVTHRPLTAHDARADRGSVIGTPIPDLALHLLDRHGRPVPRGATGELHVSGAGLARGYLHRPALTAERFPADGTPGAAPGARLYRTGDLARLRSDGELEYLGRADDQIKLRGFRIEPGEVEAALTAHPRIAAAHVRLAPDASGTPVLTAWIAVPGLDTGAASDTGTASAPAAASGPTASGPTASAPAVAELRAHLDRLVPPYMVPGAFVALPAFPLTANGKVDRRALPAPAAAGTALPAGAAYEPPAGPVETALAGIWQQVLGHPRVGAHDNWFALGGDSIRSLQVLSRARDRGIGLSLAALTRSRTLRDLAAGAGPAADRTAPAASGPEPFALLDPRDRALLPPGLDDAYPMTRLQAGMLFHSDLPTADGGRVYHNVASYLVEAPWDEAAWHATVAELAARHEMLRTSFDPHRYGEPLQLVHRDARPRITFEDLRALAEDAREAAVADRHRAERARPFRWDRAPLVRLHVQRLTDGTFRLFLAEHHATMDGWSERSLLTELALAYTRHATATATATAAASGTTGATTPAAPAAPRSRYAGYVALERAALADPAARAFWAARTDGAPVTRLPRSAPAGGPPRHTWYHRPLPAPLHARLTAVAADLRVPLRTLLLAAHLRVMALLGGADEVTTGVVVGGRAEEPDGDLVIGPFLNTLPLRLNVGPQTWRELIGRITDLELLVHEHRRFPLAEILRGNDGAPLFETFFNHTHFHVERALADAGAFTVLEETGEAATDFPFGAEFSRTPDGARLELGLRYDAARFTGERTAEAHAAYVAALTALAADPARPVHEADLLSPAEHRRIERGNATGRRFDRPHTLTALFAEQVRRTPAATAVRHDGTALTYAELDAAADRLARRLRRHGAGPGTFVALLMDRSADLPAALLAVLRSGAAYVPLDPDHPSARTESLLAECGAHLVVADARYAGPLRGTGRTVLVPGEETVPGEDSGPGNTALTVPAPRAVRPEDPAYLIFTSGSTGRPKGVVVSHRAIANRLLWMEDAYRLAPGEPVLHKTPYTFDVSVWELFWPLITGATLVVAPPGAHRDPLRIGALLRSEEVTTVHFVPSMLDVFLDDPRAVADARGLTRVVCSGEALPADLRDTFFERLPGVELHNLYGPTEAAVDVTHWQCRPGEGDTVPIGRPIANIKVHVLDARLAEVPTGVTGELYLEGTGLADGYHGRPALTAERFPLTTGRDGAPRRLYRTGDLARRRPDGALEYAGRTDHQMKVRGFRVEPGEIEAVLTGHPAVRSCAVLLRDGRLTAYVTPALLPVVTSELAAHARERLPEHMVPAAWVTLPELPLTANGKLDRAALPVPRTGGADRSGRGAAVPPRDATEARLAALWADLLGGGPVGVHDDFFELGGHSIDALRLTGRVNAAFGAGLSVGTLLERPTVARLAELLRDGAPTAGTGHAPAVVRIRPGGDLPPLVLVHPVGGQVLCYRSLAAALEPGRPVLGLTAPAPRADGRPRTVAELAALHLDTLDALGGLDSPDGPDGPDASDRARPAGPVHLAGWSFGGLVAQEMAARLAARGRPAASLTLLDTAHPEPDGVPEDENGLLEWFHQDLARTAGIDPDEEERAGLRAGLRAAVAADGTATAAAGLRALAAHTARRHPGALPEAEELAHHYAVFAEAVRAAARHRPTPVPGPVHFLQSSTGAGCDAARRWAAYAPDGLTVHELAADHYELVRPPYAAGVAEHLDAALAAADPAPAGDLASAGDSASAGDPASVGDPAPAADQDRRATPGG
ncbi:amino acid adenylation domain-containing protein [Streptomyces sp. NPDC089799]|uniref:amino acid adenylation domain-containing protein n=1 Tax=Streptomyces sp. NPDC089799 TaxID=3155066 RepID=UPI0034312DE1